MADIGAWKSQDFNGVWTRDLAIQVRRSKQLSYEATDVEELVICGFLDYLISHPQFYIWNISYITSQINEINRIYYQ